MDISVREAGFYAFGRFALDPVRRTLTRDGVPVDLTARLFDTLLYLVQNQERVVPREELERAVWGGRTVESTNLAVAISSLRKELRNDEPSESLIATLPGQGYQIRAVVTFQREPEPAPAATRVGTRGATTAYASMARSRWSGVLFLLLVLIALAATGVSVWQFNPLSKRNMKPVSAAFAPPPHSVAVLAFANLSGDPAQEYFSDGISDELINALCQIGTLHVVARSSAFSFKGKSASVQDIARRLNVGAVVEGSVRRDGDKLVIKAEMRDGVSGGLIWSQTFNRNEAQILQIQEDLAQAVATGLQQTLSGVDAAGLMVGGTSNSKALDVYLRALAAIRLPTQTDPEAHFKQTVAMLQEAVALDPKFAIAEAELSILLWVHATSGESTDLDYVRRMRQEAKAAAEKAIAMAPGSALGYDALGYTLNDNLPDFARQEAEFEHAVSLAPGNMRILGDYARFAFYAGHSSQAIEAAEKSAALSPLSAKAYFELGWNLYLARRPEDALEALRHAQELGKVPTSLVKVMTGQIALMRGDMEAATVACAGAGTWFEHECLSIAYYRLGRKDDASAEMAKLHDALGSTGAYNYAEVYAQWGRPDDALHWLETAYALHDPGLMTLKNFFMDPIRKTQRFKAIEAKLDYPP